MIFIYTHAEDSTGDLFYNTSPQAGSLPDVRANLCSASFAHGLSVVRRHVWASSQNARQLPRSQHRFYLLRLYLFYSRKFRDVESIMRGVRRVVHPACMTYCSPNIQSGRHIRVSLYREKPHAFFHVRLLRQLRDAPLHRGRFTGQPRICYRGARGIIYHDRATHDRRFTVPQGAFCACAHSLRSRLVKQTPSGWNEHPDPM